MHLVHAFSEAKVKSLCLSPTMKLGVTILIQLSIVGNSFSTDQASTYLVQ